MKPKIFSLVMASVLCPIGIGAANATSVIYNWHDLAPSPLTGAIAAQIEIDADYWSMGGTLIFAPQSPAEHEHTPYFGVSSFYFSTPSNVDSNPSVEQGFTDPVEMLSTGSCAEHAAAHGVDPIAHCSGLGLAADQVMMSDGLWNFDLSFGQYLGGSISANDTYTNVAMASADNLWTVSNLHSDSPGPCFLIDCLGGTGYWELDASTIPVSEPGTFMLFGLGLAGLAVYRCARARADRGLV